MIGIPSQCLLLPKLNTKLLSKASECCKAASEASFRACERRVELNAALRVVCLADRSYMYISGEVKPH